MVQRRRVFAALLLMAATLRGDILETRDGKRLEGAATIIGGGVMLKPLEGPPVKLKLEDIVSFDRTPVLSASEAADGLRGLMGETFADTALKTPSAITLIQGGGFDWGHAPPSPYTPANYSIRLSGFITVPQKGVYRFGGDSFSLLKINDRVIGKDRAADEAGIALDANQRVSVVAEFRKVPAQHARASIVWWSDDIPMATVPEKAFTPPEEFLTRFEQFHQKRLSETFGGLKGEYFSDHEMKHLVFTRLDPAIVMSWARSSAVNPAFTERFAARWTGRLKSPKTAKAKFALAGQGRLWIGGQQVINNVPTKENEKPSSEGFIDLKENEFYDIKLELLAGREWGQVKLVSDLEAAWMPALASKFLYPPADMPRAHIVLPLNEGEVDATHGAPIRVAVTPGKGTIKKVEIVNDDGKEVLAEVTKAPYELIIRPRLAADMKLQARVTNSLGYVALSEPTKIAINGTPGDVLGGDWSLGRAGGAPAPQVKENGSRIEITGKGGGFGDQSNLPLVSRMLAGDGELVARLVELKSDNPQTIALGGLTLRRGMRADAPHITLVGSGASGWFVTNAWRGVDIGTYVEKPLTLPVWIRIARSGSSASAYWSPDGKDWTLAGSLVLGDDRPVVAGVTAFSLTNNEPVTAVFDHIAIRGTETTDLATGAGVQLTGGAVVQGALTVQDDSIIIRSAGNRHVIPRSKIARLFYGPTKSSAVADLAPGWRGAIMANDRLEGTISELSNTGATVTSMIFGPQPVTGTGGLAALIFNEVSRDPKAIVVRHTAGVCVASELRIDADKLVIRDAELGELKLPLSDILSIRRGE